MATLLVGPEFPVPPSKLALSEDALQNPPQRGVIPTPASGDGAPSLPQSYIELAADFSAPGVVPVYTTLFSLDLTTTQPSSFVWYVFTSTWFHTGAFIGNVAVNFRFSLNGVVLPGGLTDNMVRNAIGSVSRNGRHAVTPATNPQNLLIEVSHFGAAGNVIGILVATQPTLQHAALHIEEQI